MLQLMFKWYELVRFSGFLDFFLGYLSHENFVDICLYAYIDFVAGCYGPLRIRSITVKGHLPNIDVKDYFVGLIQQNTAVCNRLQLGTFAPTPPRHKEEILEPAFSMREP